MPDTIQNIISKDELRKSVGLTIQDFDDELEQLEEAGIRKLVLSGILPSKIKSEDKLITTTILTYVKANFRFTEANLAERYQQVFEENKNFMRSTSEYTTDINAENGGV